jgi:hypothetical protein
MTKNKTDVKYPGIKVRLTGQDGNAFAIIGRVMSAMRDAKASQDDIDAFMAEAQSGDYDHLLRTCMNWVDVS